MASFDGKSSFGGKSGFDGAFSLDGNSGLDHESASRGAEGPDRVPNFAAHRGKPSSRAEIELLGIYEISKILAAPGRLDRVLSHVLSVLAGFFDLRRGLVALFDNDGTAKLAVGLGWRDGEARDHFANLPEKVVGRIVAGRTPVIVEDVARDSLFAGWSQADAGMGGSNGKSKVLGFIGVPIQDRGQVIGTLIVDRLHDGAGGAGVEEDARFLTMIANMVGQTLHLYDLVARDRERLMDEQRRLEKEPPRQPALRGEQALIGIVGASRAIREVFNQINVVARTHTTVLLRGESGAGKELFARATHDLSPRKDGPFIRLNCAALPETTLESELFGHEKGSFTGALGLRKGRFELADKGTLFLDEIGEISPSFQTRLLRALQEGEFERVGGSETVKVDVRFVFATNKNLEAAVERGRFRADLYYRINVVSILLPPLRERPEDVTLLAQEFMRRFNEENGTRKKLTANALRLLQACNFPGNVRELENCVRRTATLAREDGIVESDFACAADACLSSSLWRDTGSAPRPLVRLDDLAGEGAAPGAAALTPSAPGPDFGSPARRARLRGGSMQESARFGVPERDRLIGAMEKAGWVQAKAARLLNITPRQIAYALGKHRIPIKKF
ncbi:nif-specific transcriptional activator NifA [uncultured Rhodoblastus sp.]|uniref:nif-specific transcriptional activator NifA n=1 Tax=uncultured Rhodoblastus sp. TaxID=543037 RepID=UPI0025EE408A|nr:nif-specific transcriptional activator NifA [uncultured Rhodoblastus sp.]